MGAWGTGIFDDDTTCDVRDDFIDCLEEGKSAKEATEIILEEYLDEFSIEDDPEVMSLVYIGLSAIQMEKNCLQEHVRKTAIELIDSGADQGMWKEADEDDFEERKKIISELKQKLSEFR